MDVIVRRAGMLTTVQDLGRAGFRANGVPLSGAMDRFALRVGNLLVGNAESAAALEFTLLGPELEFTVDALVAATGADFGRLPLWQPTPVKAGQILRLPKARMGCRGYLAIAGGFDVARVLGSRSTFVRGRFGGHDGRALRDGDVLHAPEANRHASPHWYIDPRILPPYSSSAVARVVAATQTEEYDATLFTAEYQVSAQSDRMGFRLRGPALYRTVTNELRSATVVPGTVQVPPDGQPIILMADAQTIGGYPQIAHVASVDLPLVAQLRPGDTVRFARTTLAEAREAALARERAIGMLRQGLADKLG